MHWSDIIQLFNRILAPYVENLDLNQLNLGIMAGMLTHHLGWFNSLCTSYIKGRLELENLRLKKDALDKFRLPVDVLQGSSHNLLHKIPDFSDIRSSRPFHPTV
jgi:vacuolar protein sorting-associated protein 13A/C